MFIFMSQYYKEKKSIKERKDGLGGWFFTLRVISRKHLQHLELLELLELCSNSARPEIKAPPARRDKAEAVSSFYSSTPSLSPSFPPSEKT